MKNNLNRDSVEYHTIEQYKDYEFTYAVAFQMAMRNKIIIKLLIDYYSLNPHEEFNDNEKIKKIETLEKKLLDEYFIGHNILVNLKLYKETIDDKEYGYIDKSPFPRRRYDLSTYSQNYAIAYQVGKPRITEVKNELFPKFTEPRLTVPKHQDKSINLNINFSLPKKDILAYISTLKNNYDKDTKNIQTPTEQNSLTYDEAMDIVNCFNTGVELKKKDFQKSKDIIHSSLSLTKSKQGHKYADAFYIYDYIQSNPNFSKDDLFGDIEIMLNNYYTGSPTGDHLKKTQIRNYYKYMVEMIDNLKYKSLLTGNTTTTN